MSKSEEEKDIQMWKVRELIKNLDSARGLVKFQACMMHMVAPLTGLVQICQYFHDYAYDYPNQIPLVSAMLTQEFGTASIIKSRVNRLSVLSAITSAKEIIKLYCRVPPNGLAIFVGMIMIDDNKDRKVSFSFEPPKPINRSLYLCDNKFHTEALLELFISDSKFSFIVMDCNGTLFGTLAGNACNIIHKFTVNLPKNHSHGGQSALRFSRLQYEKQHNYVKKVAELAAQHFITNDKVNVSGIVLAGSADFKMEPNQSNMFDPRLAAKVISVVDVSYGGDNGFNQAIDLTGEALANVKLVQEKRLIQQYFDKISQDTGKYSIGTEDTLKGLQLSAVETLIVWENLDITRHVLQNAAGDEVVVHSKKGQEKDWEKFIDKSTGLEMEQAVEPQSLLEWLVEKYKDFGAKIEFVTDKSQEGAQFVKGFGGIGGLLRYRVDFTELATLDDSEDEFYSDEGDL